MPIRFGLFHFHLGWGIGLEVSKSTKATLTVVSIVNAIVFFVNAGIMFNQTEADLLAFKAKSKHIDENSESIQKISKQMDWMIRNMCKNLPDCSITDDSVNL